MDAGFWSFFVLDVTLLILGVKTCALTLFLDNLAIEQFAGLYEECSKLSGYEVGYTMIQSLIFVWWRLRILDSYHVCFFFSNIYCQG